MGRPRPQILGRAVPLSLRPWFYHCSKSLTQFAHGVVHLNRTLTRITYFGTSHCTGTLRIIVKWLLS